MTSSTCTFWNSFPIYYSCYNNDFWWFNWWLDNPTVLREQSQLFRIVCIFIIYEDNKDLFLLAGKPSSSKQRPKRKFSLQYLKYAVKETSVRNKGHHQLEWDVLYATQSIPYKPGFLFSCDELVALWSLTFNSVKITLRNKTSKLIDWSILILIPSPFKFLNLWIYFKRRHLNTFCTKFAQNCGACFFSSHTDLLRSVGQLVPSTIELSAR